MRALTAAVVRRPLSRIRPVAAAVAVTATLLLGCTLMLESAGAVFTAGTQSLADSFAADTLNAPVPDAPIRACGVSGPTYVAGSSMQNLGASISLAVPAAAQVGDWLVAGISAWDDTLTGISAAQAGWTKLRAGVSGYNQFAVFARVIPSPKPASYSFNADGTTGSANSGVMAAYQGVQSVESHAVSAFTTSSTAIAPTVTPASSPTLLVTVFGHGDATMTIPPGQTARETAVAGFSSFRVRFFDEAITGTTATGTRQGSLASSKLWIGASVLLKSSGSGVPDPTVNLSWAATPDTYADGYEIVRNGIVTTQIVGRGTLSWTDATTNANTAYSYTIKAKAGDWRSAAEPFTTVNSC